MPGWPSCGGRASLRADLSTPLTRTAVSVISVSRPDWNIGTAHKTGILLAPAASTPRPPITISQKTMTGVTQASPGPAHARRLDKFCTIVPAAESWEIERVGQYLAHCAPAAPDRGLSGGHRGDLRYFTVNDRWAVDG